MQASKLLIQNVGFSSLRRTVACMAYLLLLGNPGTMTKQAFLFETSNLPFLYLLPTLPQTFLVFQASPVYLCKLHSSYSIV